MPETPATDISPTGDRFSERPAGDDWRVLWNVPAEADNDEDDVAPDEFDDAEQGEDEGDPAPEYTYAASVPCPPAWWRDGLIEDLKRELLQSLIEYLSGTGIPMVDEHGERLLTSDGVFFSGEAIGAFGPLDRTLEVALVAPDLFPAGCVRHLQKTFLRRHPLWRIYVAPSWRDGEEGLTIYPDAVRVGRGTLCPPSDLDASVAVWLRSIREIREPHEGRRTDGF